MGAAAGPNRCPQKTCPDEQEACEFLGPCQWLIREVSQKHLGNSDNDKPRHADGQQYFDWTAGHAGSHTIHPRLLRIHDSLDSLIATHLIGEVGPHGMCRLLERGWIAIDLDHPFLLEGLRDPFVR